MEGKLPFDPIDEAARQWAKHWDGVPQMHAVTSLMRVQQLVLGRLDALLRPHGLTFARYEALVLLCFSSAGSLPLGKMGERLQVHPTSITSIITRLESSGFVVRRPHPVDGRAVLAEITDAGRAVVEAATADLVGADFGLGALGRRAAALSSSPPCPPRARCGRRPETSDSWEFSWTSYYLGHDGHCARALAGEVRRGAGRSATRSGCATPTSPRSPARRSTRRTARRPPRRRHPRFSEIGWPGEFPFTRGLHATGHRGRTWTIRQFAGFGNAEQTNERYKMILGRGGGGLSVAFDMPTLMGRDSDDPKSLGEVGHCGVAIDSVADMELLFDGIDLGEVTTSMTISGPAVPVFCMMLVAAERAGVDTGILNGTLQTDIFKEYIAQKEWLFTARAAPAPDRRPDGALPARDPGVQAALGLRLPHP